jgi:hypothetical protein
VMAFGNPFLGALSALSSDSDFSVERATWCWHGLT